MQDTRQHRLNKPAPEIILRTLTEEFPIKHPEVLESAGLKFRKILDHRDGWVGVDTLRHEVGIKSRQTLKHLLGFSGDSSKADWKRLCEAGIIEVSIDAASPLSIVAQEFPWEFLLSSATEPDRSASALVIRRLTTSRKISSHKKQLSSSKPKRLLVIRSLPKFLQFLENGYDDESLAEEQNNIEATLGLKDKTPLINPKLKELKTVVSRRKPQIVHLAGFASMQIARMQKLQPGEPGMMLLRDDGNFYSETPQSVAEALCSANTKPALIAFNFSYSVLMGAAAVEHGASASICFQGEISDLIAEIFFCNFYLACQLSTQWRILDAFRLAWQKLAEKQRSQLQGTGIILWTRESLLDLEKRYRAQHPSIGPIDYPPLELEIAFDDHIERLADKSIPLYVWVSPLKALNYSMLHNNRSPFESFVIDKNQPIGRVEGIEVEVVLHVGQERMPYNAVGAMDYSYWLLHDEVRLPLTSVLARSVRESVYTSIFVKVSRLDSLLYEQTHRVKLLPIDHWQDDDNNRQWLPSFVLPRDPVIAQIVDCAQKYVGLLTDDYSAGFDGYFPNTSDVDHRVRSIWWTLTHDMPLKYIAPPPTFLAAAQRLRTPSEILSSHRGTCVDLALLVASCLEYVDLYPVIFLLYGHAFAGYYRSPQIYLAVRDWAIEESSSSHELWLLGQDFYEFLIQLVQQGDIIPLETVCLTQQQGFWRAVEEGGLNLRSKSSFQFMVDIKLARECDITPLPL